MLSRDELCVVATWDDAQMSFENAQKCVESLMELIIVMTTPDRWAEAVGKVLKDCDHSAKLE